MTRLKRTLFPVLMTVCMLFAAVSGNVGCAQKDSPNYREEFQELLQEINEKNENINMPSAIPKEYLPPTKIESLPQEDYELWEQACARQTEEAYIAKEDAQKELAWVKRLLKNYYGNYYRFGGDDKFDAAIENVLAVFQNRDKIESGVYQQELGEQFAFIEDSHFTIGFSGNTEVPETLLTDATDFYRKNGKFYLDKKCRQEVIEIEGQSPDTYLRRSIGPDGTLTWYPYVRGEQGAGYKELKICYREGLIFKKEKEKVVELSLADYLGSGTPERGDIFTYEEKGEVPYIKLDSFARQDSDSAIQFIKSAEKLKDAPNAVIDLTENNGGTISTLDAWFDTYAGSQWYPHGGLISREHKALEVDENIQFEAESERVLYPKLGMKDKGSYGVLIPEKKPLIKNDRRLFLLVSRNSASCAELTTDACRCIENTVIIGTNTGGHLTGDIMKAARLPLSGAWFSLGTAMFYWDETYFQEGVGFEPDIYLTGKDCEDRLEKFWNKYVVQ